MAKRKASARAKKPAAKKTATRSALQKQMVKDVYVGPSHEQIQRSFRQSKTESLAAFRSKIGW